MTALDQSKSEIIEKTGVFVAVSVISLMGVSIVLPYVAAALHITIDQADKASLNQMETTISNVFVAVVSFFFGASAGTRKKDDTIQTLTTTAAKAQDALAPVVAAVAGAAQAAPDGDVMLQPGQNVNVAAVPLVKPNDIDTDMWESLTDADKTAEIARRAPAKQDNK